MKRLAPIALLLVACGNFGLAQPHVLLLAFKTGDSYRYQFHSVTKLTVGIGAMTVPVDVDVSARETVTVKSVDASGTADLALTMSNLTVKTVTANGVTNTTTVPTESSEVHVASDGRPTEWNGAQVTNGNAFMALSALGGSFFISAVLPTGKVKPGDSWTKNYDQSSSDGKRTVRIASKSTYVRDAMLNGVNAAVVETKSTGNFNIALSGSQLRPAAPSSSPLPIALGGITMTGTITTDVTTWIDPNGRRVMQSHSTATDQGTMNIQASPAESMPGLSGPITINGSSTSDLTPA